MAEIRAHVNRHASKYAALVMATAAFAAPMEGFKSTASHNWFDPPGTVDIGFGSTSGDIPGLKIGDHITKPEAEKLLADKLATKYLPPLRICIHNFDAMPQPRQIAFLDASYNLGYGGVCRSSMARKINWGDVQGACDAFLEYTHANHRVLPGLVKRRQNERALCLQDN
jgi:lysozyme